MRVLQNWQLHGIYSFSAKKKENIKPSSAQNKNASENVVCWSRLMQIIA